MRLKRTEVVNNKRPGHFRRYLKAQEENVEVGGKKREKLRKLKFN